MESFMMCWLYEALQINEAELSMVPLQNPKWGWLSTLFFNLLILVEFICRIFIPSKRIMGEGKSGP